MSLKQNSKPSRDAIDRIAGVTGLGWTASALGYLGTVIGYGNSLVTNPQSLLYLGGLCFLATLGLDRLNQGGPDQSEESNGSASADGPGDSTDPE